MSISKKIKEWYISIESQKFDGIAEEVKKILPLSNPKYNNHIDSLITRLTRSYINYHDSKKGDIAMGLTIYELTHCLCEIFTESSNPSRLRSGIYHITRCLRELKLYSESQKLCNYIIPGKIFSHDSQDNEYFLKLSHAWRHSIDMEIKSLSSTKFDLKKYNSLLEMIKFDFQLLKYADKLENYSVILFGRLQRYIDQIIISDKEWTNNRIITFINDMIEYIKTLQSNSNLIINPLKVYDEIIDIMHCLSMRMIKSNKINEVWNFINKCASKFEIFLEINSEAKKTFQLQLDFYKILIKPITNFDEEMLKEICNYKSEFENRLKISNQKNLLKANSLAISKILTSLFNYWLKCLNSCKTECFNKIFFEIVELINHAAMLLSDQRLKNCKCDLTTCTVKYNSYEQINIILKCGVFICMIDKKELSKELVNFSRDFINEIIISIYEYKQTKCGLYSHLWSTCGQVMYNFGLLTSIDYLDDSAEILSNLCSFIIQEDGIKCKNNFLRTSNPLSLVLHKLSGVYYRAEKYREAMIVTAFNGLISYDDNDSRAFKMWANIKHKYKTESKDIKQTMIECLKADKIAIKELGVEIELNDYNLIKLCIKEIQGLQMAKVCLTGAIKACLKELDSLKKNTIEYVEGVQYLGYHLIYFRDDCTISEYLKRAEYYLSIVDKDSTYNSCLKANIQFFKFMDQCNTTGKKIKEDIKNAKDILQKRKNQTHDETIEPDEVVPVYRTINMKHNEQVFLDLRKILRRWKKIFAKDPKEIINCWEPKITLDIIIIAGEVARLHLSQENEKRAWLLAYELASVLEDHSSCLYVTARIISLRYINNNWIDKVHNYAVSLKTSDDIEDKNAAGMFWTSLSDFYFETGKIKEAVILLDKVKDLESVSLKENTSLYLDYLDTIIRYYQFYSKTSDQELYAELIVNHVYAMITVNGSLEIGGRKTYYGLNTLLDAVNNMSLVMFNFISFREISVHLTLRLELAQSLGATLRVAECLKSLSYIDLSRFKLDDCEIKLQGIEQILDIEGFGLSMNNKTSKLHNERTNIILSRRMDVDDPLRDVMENNASPILRKKFFSPPEFMLHDKCECYRCLNIPYQHLIFSCTYIRAQMYSLKNYSSLAVQHFQGSLDVRTKVLTREKILNETNITEKRYSWKKYYTTVDFILMMIDFSKFLMYHETEPNEKNAMQIAFEAINICKINNLQTHPVFTAANELLFSYRMQKINPSFKAFTVPDVNDVEITDLIPDNAFPLKSCATPSHSGELPLKILHKDKIPYPLPKTKVDMIFSESEDEEDNTTTKKTRRQPCRKRLIIDEIDTIGDSLKKVSILSDDETTKNETSESSKSKLEGEKNIEPVASTSSLNVESTKIKRQSRTKTPILTVSSDVENLQIKRLSSRNKITTSVKSESSKSKTQTKKINESEESGDSTFSLSVESTKIKRQSSRTKTLTVSSDVENSQTKRLSSRNKATTSTRTESVKTKSETKKILSIDKAQDSDDSMSSTSSGIEKSHRRSRRLAKQNSKSLSPNRCSSPELFTSDDEFCLKKK